MVVQLDTREILVQQVNDHGIKADGAWFNISKFAPERDVLLPSVGERVVVTLDRSGFVRKVEPAVAPATAPIATQTAPQAPTGPMAGHTPPEPSTGPTIEQDAKGTVILRMNVMTTATAILASGGRTVNPDEVLALAGRLEGWAVR